MRRVYLDNNATTFMSDEVRRIFASSEFDSNASSMYSSSRAVAQLLKNARESIAKSLYCKDSELLFTSGATESNNTVLSIAKDIIAKKGSGKILTTAIEHPSVREVLLSYKKAGVDVIFAPVDSRGVVDVKFCKKALEEGGVVLTSIMYANNEVGSIQPIEELSSLAHKNKSLFHTDATQAAGKIELNFEKIGADYMSLSAHKVYGPKGIGALIVKEDAPFESLLLGGHQENGRRAGTYNSNAICAFAKALELSVVSIDSESKKLLMLKDRLEKGLLSAIDNIRINTDRASSLPGTLNVSFRNIEGESILLMMDFEGIEVSTGSACATGSLEPSYVLLAMGVPVEDAHGSIRFSFGAYNTEEDVDYVLEKLPEIVEKLRNISTRR